MLDKNKIKLMTKLAKYEQDEENNALAISSYYRRDYIGLSLIKNFFATTIAWGLLMGLIILLNFERFMQMLTDLQIESIVRIGIISYVIMLVLYSVLTYIVSSIRYARAQKSIKNYKAALEELESMYEEKDDLL